MKSISLRLDDLLDRYFHWIIIVVAFFIFQKVKANSDKKNEEEFTANLLGFDTPETQAAAAVITTAKKENTKTGTMEKFFNSDSSAKTEEQKKALHTLRTNEANKMAASFASRLRGAFHPSGSSFIGGFDGTDEDAIKEVFRLIRWHQQNNGKYLTFALVSKKYKDAYGDDLRKDLESELDVAEVTEYVRGI